MRETMFTRSAGDQDGVPNLGIVITDGRSNDEQDTWDEARLAREQGINMIAIGIGSSIKVSELEAIASDPNEMGENVLQARDFNDLQNLRGRLIETICNSEYMSIML